MVLLLNKRRLTMTKLRTVFIQDLTLKGLGEKTIGEYVSQVARFAQYYSKSPIQLTEQDVRKYLYYLITEKKLSSSSVNKAYCAIKFLYEITLGRSFFMQKIPKMKKSQHRLPLVLEKQELKKLFSSITNLKYQAIILVVYSAGLRISEATNLRISDIERRNMRLRIQCGKGSKERYSKLAKQTLVCLERYYRAYKPLDYLFPGSDKTKPISTRAVAIVFKKALLEAGIKKPAVLHSLRHSFASHLLDQNENLTTIQKLLGHSSIRSTVIYIHVSHTTLNQVISPLDTEEFLT